jgi:hypothetical protein
MRRLWLAAAVTLATVLMGGPVYAGSDPAAQSTVPAPTTVPQPETPLVLSIRALSVGPTTFTDTGEVERVKASNGSGTSTWPPAATRIGNGVYISVMPGCIPGVDEPSSLGARRRR